MMQYEEQVMRYRQRVEPIYRAEWHPNLEEWMVVGALGEVIAYCEEQHLAELIADSLEFCLEVAAWDDEVTE